MEKHLYIDYSNIFFRILYATERDLKSMGYGILRHCLVKNILGVVQKYKADKVYVLCDAKSNWRKGYYAPYKGTRKDSRDKHDIDWEQAFEMSENVKQGLKKYFPFYVLEENHLEADDIIGHLCKTYPQVEKMIISPDRDFVQLGRYGNLKIYDVLNDKFIHSDTPLVALQQKIIMGDKSDNVPSIQKGLGEVKSLRLIESGEIDKIISEKNPAGEPTEIALNYERNSKLIDLSRTPTELITRLKKSIDEYTLARSNNIYEFFDMYELIDLRMQVDRINGAIRHLNPPKNDEDPFTPLTEAKTYNNKFEALFNI